QFISTFVYQVASFYTKSLPLMVTKLILTEFVLKFNTFKQFFYFFMIKLLKSLQSPFNSSHTLLSLLKYIRHYLVFSFRLFELFIYSDKIYKCNLFYFIKTHNKTATSY